MSSLVPRAVLVTRPSDYEALLARHATRNQAKFFLRSRGQDIDRVELRHRQIHAVVKEVREAVPAAWRCTHVLRDQLDRFLFSPEDVVLAVGQDGLVANLAKYLQGQPVLGVNPEPEVNAGILVPLRPDQVGGLLPAAAGGAAQLEARTLAQATLDDGQKLLALNEIFIGHQSHQSARYHLEVGGREERQSSSGLIVATGTGASGWAKSIMESRGLGLDVGPLEPTLALLVREAFASPTTGTALSTDIVTKPNPCRVLSRMNDGGVIFADGIESDHLRFDWGRRVEVSVAEQHLNLVVG